MQTILILFAHPALQKSRVNAQLIDGIDGIDGVTFHDLYQRYPEFDIDVKAEQELLRDHDAIVFHHPLFWYSTPAILKEWQDLVLEHGWAYGREGTALQDKLFFSVVTTGGRAEAYSPEGYAGFGLRQLLAPIEQTARLCRMRVLPPYVVHGTHSLSETDVKSHRESYHSLLQHIIEEDLVIDSARKASYLNTYLRETEGKVSHAS